ncbi:MAG: VOC family protein, partial [Flavobacterium sp.]
NLTINVKDMDKSVAFYQSIGLEVKNRWGNHYAQLTAPGIVIGLHPTDNENLFGSGNVSIGFTADDFEEVKTQLAKSGIETTQRTEQGGEFIHFKDPDGTELYFIKPNW